MRKKIVAICLFVILAIAAVMSVMPTQAVGEGIWITSYKVVDSKTDEVLMEVDFAKGTNATYSSILSGAELKVTVTINVLPGSGKLKLSTNMMHSSTSTSLYWELVTQDYDMGSDFNPNSQSTEFNWEKGNFTIICYGKVYNVVKPTPFALVQLWSGSDVLDEIKPIVVTAGGSQFQSLLDSQEAKLQSLVDSGVATGYTQLFENVLNESKALYNAGYVNEAIALLNALPNSGEPVGSAFEMVMLPAVGIAAALAVVFAFMFIRARGKMSYVRLVIEDQIKDLEGLTLRAQKIDRTISSNLDSVKDRLKRLVGM
jgi:hypothetical protein